MNFVWKNVWTLVWTKPWQIEIVHVPSRSAAQVRRNESERVPWGKQPVFLKFKANSKKKQPHRSPVNRLGVGASNLSEIAGKKKKFKTKTTISKIAANFKNCSCTTSTFLSIQLSLTDQFAPNSTFLFSIELDAELKHTFGGGPEAYCL